MNFLQYFLQIINIIIITIRKIRTFKMRNSIISKLAVSNNDEVTTQ